MTTPDEPRPDPDPSPERDRPPPLRPEDLARLLVVADVSLSSDGSRFAYVVRRADLPRNGYVSELRTAAFEGPVRARLVARPVATHGRPRWQPGKAAIAYLSRPPSRRTGTARRQLADAAEQLVLVGGAGGRPRRLTSFPGGCRDFAWAPGGQWLVCVAASEADGTEPGAARVHRRLPLKADGVGYLDARRHHLWQVFLDGTPPRQLTEGDGDDWHPAVSPDDVQVAFASNRSAEGPPGDVADIWVLHLGTGALRRVTPGGGRYGSPSWRPSGRELACFGVAEAEGWQVRSTRPWRFRADGGGGLDLAQAWEGTAGSPIVSDTRSHAHVLAPGWRVPPVWTGDGAQVLFLGAHRGAANLYACPAAGGDVRPVTSGRQQLVSFSVDASVTRFAAVASTARDPGDIVVGRLDGSARPRTRLNGRFLASRFVAQPEPFTFSGRDGAPIDGWLMRPYRFDPSRRWPLVLEIHGGPHLAYGYTYFHEFQVLAGRGYAVLGTNPRGSQTYGDAFALAAAGDWGGLDAEDLLAGVEAALGLGWVDPERLYVTGGSFGGFMTNWLITRTTRFRAAVSQRSVSNVLSAFGSGDEGEGFWAVEMGGARPWTDPAALVQRSPLTHAASIWTPLLLLHGERDLRCPIDQAEQLFVALQALDREVVLVRYPEDGHDLTRSGRPRSRVDHCRRIVDWFDAHP